MCASPLGAGNKAHGDGFEPWARGLRSVPPTDTLNPPPTRRRPRPSSRTPAHAPTPQMAPRPGRRVRRAGRRRPLRPAVPQGQGRPPVHHRRRLHRQDRDRRQLDRPVKPVRSVSVGSFVSGPINEIYVDFNSKVKKGQLLAQIDPRLLQAPSTATRRPWPPRKAELARIEAPARPGAGEREARHQLRKTNKDYISDTEMDQLHVHPRWPGGPARPGRGQHRAGPGQPEERRDQPRATPRSRRRWTASSSSARSTRARRWRRRSRRRSCSSSRPDMDKHMHVFASVDEADIGQIPPPRSRAGRSSSPWTPTPTTCSPGHIFQVRMNVHHDAERRHLPGRHRGPEPRPEAACRA